MLDINNITLTENRTRTTNTDNMTDFSKCLEYEKSQQPLADKFYNSLGVTKIERCSWNDPKGKELQRKDIDVIVTFSDGHTEKISEKFRKGDWGDMMVELWSGIEGDGTPGWLDKSEADYIYYYTPGLCRVIPVQSLKEFTEHFKEVYTLETLKDSLKIDNTFLANVMYNGHLFDVRIRKIRSTSRATNGFYKNILQENEWFGVTYSITWKNLINCGIDVKSFKIK